MKNKVRPIDANAAIEALAANFRQVSADGCDNPFYQIAEDTIAEMPTVTDNFPDLTKMVPLTLEQLREMDGHPVWIVESPDWGHWELSEDAEDYLCDRDTDLYGLTYPDPDGKAGLHKLGWVAYAYPPAHIDREAWKPCGLCKSCGNCTEAGKASGEKINYAHPCHSCLNGDNFKPVGFCRYCGRLLTEEAWTELEKRVRG